MPKKLVPLVERIWRHVEPEPNSGCWLWAGSLMFGGYGSLGVGGKMRRAHRVMWELVRGSPPPVGLDLDHLCRVRCCVNPDHMEPVTRRVNANRGLHGFGKPQRKDPRFCRNGHELTPDNSYHFPDSPHRTSCRMCARIARKRWQDKQPILPLAPRLFCGRGHALTPENTFYYAPQGGPKGCRTCKRFAGTVSVRVRRERTASKIDAELLRMESAQ